MHIHLPQHTNTCTHPSLYTHPLVAPSLPPLTPPPHSPFTSPPYHHTQDTTAWACLASFALKAGQLSLALQCYAALDKVHKVHVLKSLTGAGGGAGDPLSQGPTKAGAPSAAATRHAVVLALLRGDAVAAEVALCRV